VSLDSRGRAPWPRRLGLLALLAALGGALVPGQAKELAVGSAALPRPRLVLFVSVDQMRFDYLTRFGPLFTDGFKTLLERGAVFSNARYRHSNTETGPGHAALLSGRHARDNGIVANAWYDSLLKREVNVVEDIAQSPVGGLGRGASPANFIGVTIGDLLKKVSPESKVVGVALKDRAAILMPGRRADAAYWYEAAQGRFITSTYYMRTAPAWLDAWNAEGHVDALFGKPWTRLLSDTALYEKYAGPDAVEGESDRVDTTFPHKVAGQAKSKEFYDELRSTPSADELILDVAFRAMAEHGLGQDEATDILAVGFSATDYIGHTYGPDSQELMDQMLRLDKVLGRLLTEVDKRVGAGRVLFGLSADHGVMPLVEVLQQQGKPAHREKPPDLESGVRKALEQRFPGAQDLIAEADVPNFYLDLDKIRARGLKRSDVEVAIEAALLASGLVDRVYTHARLLGDPPADDPDFAFFRNSFFEPRSPHVIARLKPYIYLDDYPGGTGHGTSADYDRHVPVVFLGNGLLPGRYSQGCGPEDIAPTLSALLGLEYPLESGQRVLSEALSH